MSCLAEICVLRVLFRLVSVTPRKTQTEYCSCFTFGLFDHCADASCLISLITAASSITQYDVIPYALLSASHQLPDQRARHRNIGGFQLQNKTLSRNERLWLLAKAILCFCCDLTRERRVRCVNIVIRLNSYSPVHLWKKCKKVMKCVPGRACS